MKLPYISRLMEIKELQIQMELQRTQLMRLIFETLKELKGGNKEIKKYGKQR